MSVENEEVTEATVVGDEVARWFCSTCGKSVFAEASQPSCPLCSSQLVLLELPPGTDPGRRTA
jgi:ABC-type ATPase with predicted acetyltransferase domain